MTRSASSAEPSPRLRPSLKRSSYSGGTGSGPGGAAAAEAVRAPSTLRRTSSFPRSHSLSRTLSLGDILADKEALDMAEIEASCEGKVRAPGNLKCLRLHLEFMSCFLSVLRLSTVYSSSSASA